LLYKIAISSAEQRIEYSIPCSHYEENYRVCGLECFASMVRGSQSMWIDASTTTLENTCRTQAFGKLLAFSQRITNPFGGFMNRKRRIHTLRSFAVLVLVSGMVFLSVQLHAQQTSSSPQQYPAQRPGQEAGQQPQQQPGQTPDQSGQPAPDSQAQAQQHGVQVFTGTIVKSGDKFAFQDSASGTTYDIDHQDEVRQFEGKKVRVHGTLDPNGKMIHVQ
jgi:uncharacterized protein YdeI (BOF family)